MQTLNLVVPRTPLQMQDKVRPISPWLEASSEIYTKYFGKNPTELSLLEVRNEVIQEYCDLPLRDIAAVLALVDIQYGELPYIQRLVK